MTTGCVSRAARNAYHPAFGLAGETERVDAKTLDLKLDSLDLVIIHKEFARGHVIGQKFVDEKHGGPPVLKYRRAS